MNDSHDLIPGPATIAGIERECLRQARRRSLMAGATALIPPGLDIAVDVAIVQKMVAEISERFGLAQWQLERLSPQRQAVAYSQIQSVGAALLGKALTTQTVLAVLQRTGVAAGTRSVAKVVPIAGQVISAVAGYALAMYVARRHIAACAGIALALGTAIDRQKVVEEAA